MPERMTMKICVLPGDGIGLEIMAEAVRVLKSLDLKFEIEEALLGGCAVDATGSPFPEATQKLAQAADAVLLGAVGVLQFEVVAQRLQTEYKVDAIFEPADINTARWLTFPDEITRKNFEREQQHRMAKDVDGNYVYLASTRYNLDVAREKWTKVGFHASREHGQKLE